MSHLKPATYIVDGITDHAYATDLPNDLVRTLRKAESAGLFEDFRCGHCELSQSLDWRGEKIKHDGLHFICDDCGDHDVIGMDIIKEAAAEELTKAQ
jgi:hypothetical protein